MAPVSPVVAAEENTPAGDSLAAIIKIPDPFVRMSALEKHYQRQRRAPGEAGVDRNLLLHLTDTAFQVRNFPLVLRYGEEGLRRDWNNPRLKMALYFSVARACEELDLNIGKALRYAGYIHRLAQVVDPAATDPLIWKRYVAPALRLSMRLKVKTAGDKQAWRSALDNGIAALAVDATEEAGRELYETARRARASESGGEAALEALEALCRSSLARVEYINRLAFWYSRDGLQDKAADWMIKSYNEKPDPAVAYTIGKLLQSRDLPKAMQYLAESVHAGKGEAATRSRRLLEHLFFNVHAGEMDPGEKEAAFDRLMREAAERLRSRVKKKIPESPGDSSESGRIKT